MATSFPANLDVVDDYGSDMARPRAVAPQVWTMNVLNHNHHCGFNTMLGLQASFAILKPARLC